jgi:hypothetical protein
MGNRQYRLGRPSPREVDAVPVQDVGRAIAEELLEQLEGLKKRFGVDGQGLRWIGRPGTAYIGHQGADRQQGMRSLDGNPEP